MKKILLEKLLPNLIPIESSSEEDEEFWGLSDDSEESYWMPTDDE